jgi:excisionase family DNA binding protein
MKRGSQQKATKQSKRAVWRELSGELLTQEELAVQLKVTLRTVWNWQACGILPFLRMGKCVRFYWPAVLSHLIENFVVLRGTSVPGPSGLPPCRPRREKVFGGTPKTAAEVPTESKTAK